MNIMNNKPLIRIRHYEERKWQPQSKIIIGDMEIFITKKFNWFNRLMIRLVFGFKVERMGNNEYKT